MPCKTPRARDLVLWCYSVFLKVHNTFMSWIFMCCPEIFGDMPLTWFRGTGFPLTLYFLVHNVSAVAVIFFPLPWISTTMCLHTICPSISGHDLQKLWIKIINCLGNLLRLSKDDWYTASSELYVSCKYCIFHRRSKAIPMSIIRMVIEHCNFEID